MAAYTVVLINGEMDSAVDWVNALTAQEAADEASKNKPGRVGFWPVAVFSGKHTDRLWWEQSEAEAAKDEGLGRK